MSAPRQEHRPRLDQTLARASPTHLPKPIRGRVRLKPMANRPLTTGKPPRAVSHIEPIYPIIFSVPTALPKAASWAARITLTTRSRHSMESEPIIKSVRRTLRGSTKSNTDTRILRPGSSLAERKRVMILKYIVTRPCWTSDSKLAQKASSNIYQTHNNVSWI